MHRIKKVISIILCLFVIIGVSPEAIEPTTILSKVLKVDVNIGSTKLVESGLCYLSGGSATANINMVAEGANNNITCMEVYERGSIRETPKLIHDRYPNANSFNFSFTVSNKRIYTIKVYTEGKLLKEIQVQVVPYTPAVTGIMYRTKWFTVTQVDGVDVKPFWITLNGSDIIPNSEYANVQRELIDRKIPLDGRTLKLSGAGYIEVFNRDSYGVESPIATYDFLKDSEYQAAQQYGWASSVVNVDFPFRRSYSMDYETPLPHQYVYNVYKDGVKQSNIVNPSSSYTFESPIYPFVQSMGLQSKIESPFKDPNYELDTTKSWIGFDTELKDSGWTNWRYLTKEESQVVLADVNRKDLKVKVEFFYKPKEVGIPSGRFGLDAKPDNLVVWESATINNTHSLSVDMLQSQDNINTFKAYLLKKPADPIQLSIKISRDKAGASITNSVYKSDGSYTSIDSKTLIDLIEGKKVIFSDNFNGIPIKEDETIQVNYSADINVRIGSTVIPLTRDPGEDYVKYYRPAKLLGSYTSVPSYFSEIKTNKPLNETFDAMSGTPTTRDLYFASGGSEFIVSIEVEYVKDGKASRDYHSHYGGTECEFKKRDTAIMGGQSHSFTETRQQSSGTIAIHGSAPTPPSPAPKTYSWTDSHGQNKTITESVSTNFSVTPPKCGCPGHSHSVSDGKGGSTTVTDPCPKGGHCLDATGSYSYSITYTVAPHAICGPCCEHDLPDVEHSWKQDSTFDYTKINNVAVWKITDSKVNGMRQLIKTDEVSASIVEGDPNIFYNIAKTNTSKDGRLRYSLETDQHDDVIWNEGTRTNKCNKQEQSWGTGIQGGIGYDVNSATSKDKSTVEYNKFIERRNLTTNVTAISDFLILQTTSGDQSVMYFQKESIVKKAIEQLDVPKTSFEQQWKNNPLSSAQWVKSQVNVGSYNGNFANPGAKYNIFSSNKIQTIFDSKPAGLIRPNHPTEGLKLYKDKLDIPDTLPNGEYITGNSSVFYTNILNYGPKEKPYAVNNNIRYGKSGQEFTSTYSSVHTKINDVVIHNPVSSQYAIVMPNPAYLDQRTETSEKGGNLQPPEVEYEKVLKPGYVWIPPSPIYEKVKVSNPDYHKHDDTCKPVKKYLCNNLPLNTSIAGKWHHDLNCQYGGQTHDTTSTSSCSQCGHNCGNLETAPSSGHTHDLNCEHTTVYSCGKEDTSGTLPKPATVVEYAYTGKVETYIIPATGVYTFELWGAQGGNNQGGFGGYSKGSKLLNKGDIIEIRVGGTNGYNGGGTSNRPEGFGGGGTDIRVNGSTITNRFIIAGGGGGNGPSIGGAGGGLQGADGVKRCGTEGKGGTQTSGGSGGSNHGGSGSLGQGGSNSHDSANGSAGGGGGYYGGGAGGHDCSGYNDYDDSGAGGGSSFIGGVDNGEIKLGINSGNGKISVTTPQLPADPGVPEFIEKEILSENQPPMTPPEDAYIIVEKKTDKDKQITIPNLGTVTAGNFINLDMSFQVYFPNRGDFFGDGRLGVSNTREQRGYGFTDNMNTTEWTKRKTVTFDFNVIYLDKLYKAGEEIDLDVKQDTFSFYCVLGNYERKSAPVIFKSYSINDTSDDIVENDKTTNRVRYDNLAAKADSTKNSNVDILGNIGNMIMEDTGDFRFSNFFKQPVTEDKWLVKNIVKEVDQSKQNNIIGSTTDIRGNSVSEGTKYLNTWGLTSHAQMMPKPFPLSPSMNNIESLRKQPLRIGYNMFLDVQTTGNYYSSTKIKPKYYSLNLDSGEIDDVDIYMDVDNQYKSIYKSDNTKPDYEYSINFKFDEEKARRNITQYEDKLTQVIAQSGGIEYPKENYAPLGGSNQLNLNGNHRTFIGSDRTYGVDKNPEARISSSMYNIQAQRWHFTIGLPSSAVIVRSGAPCSKSEIDKYRDNKHVIIVGAEIVSIGNLYSLEYKQPVSSMKVEIAGKTYDLSKIKFNLIAITSANKSSADDLDTFGTH